MRTLVLLLAGLSIAPAAVLTAPEREYVQAVEFPYYLYPRQLWEQELVWMKTIGVHTVAFSIPWNWHQPEPGPPDFTGRTSPRRDVLGFVQLLRRLGLRAWVRPLPPVKNWGNAGYPAWAAQDRRAQRQWLKDLEALLGTRVEKHGGPVAFVEGAPGVLDAPAPPAPIQVAAADDRGALARSRQAIAGARGSLIWENVEDAVYPAGWEPPAAPLLRRGAVSLNGDELPSVSALRRDAALLRQWARLLPSMRAQPLPGKLPRGLSGMQLVTPGSGGPSAVSVLNYAEQPYRGELRVRYPSARRTLIIPHVEIPASDALWLPIDMPLASGGLCRECSVFANSEHIVYATAELQTVEWENGILAMEFSAPVAGEVVLQLAREPSGPFLAAGRPTKFDWDEKTFRARLPVPQGKGPGSRVRIGLAIAAPETSAFFVDATRLIIGRKNTVSTSYSSPELAARSRLRAVENFAAKPVSKSPTEIDYQIDVPPDASHGDWANFALEADGVPLGRARLQLFRPASMRLSEATKLHFGQIELPVDPLLVAIEPNAGRNLDITIRNNSPQIQNFVLESAGEGLKFFPAKTEITIGAVMERVVSVRVFSEDGASGIHHARLRLSGGAPVEMPLRVAAIPRGQTVAYSADLDGDGAAEWVLENQRARAVFSTQDGGRWLEFVWKDSGLNVLPDEGALVGTGSVKVRQVDGGLAFEGRGFTRTVRLAGSEAKLTVEQSTPLAALSAGKKNEVQLEVTRETPNRVVYLLRVQK